MIEFIQAYPNHRINIIFPPGQVSISTMKALSAISDKVYVKLSYSDLLQTQELKDNNIKFFFNAATCVENYTTLNDFVALGVTDIYPAGDLLYGMDNLREWANDRNINLRLVLNSIPSTALYKGQDEKSMIYRPEDIDMLADYFDAFEFQNIKNDKRDLDILYKIWFKDKTWNGQISEINEEVEMDFPNQSLVPEFTKYKMNCERVCDRRVKNHCNKCSQFLEIARYLNQQNIRLKIMDKKKQSNLSNFEKNIDER